MGCSSSKTEDEPTNKGKVVSSSSASSTNQHAAAMAGRQNGSVHSAQPEPPDKPRMRSDADVRTEARVRADAERQMVKSTSTAGDSAGSRMSVLRIGQASFGSSTASASSDQRSPQSSFEGHEAGSGGRASDNGGPALLVAICPSGERGPQPAAAQHGGAQLRAPAHQRPSDFLVRTFIDGPASDAPISASSSAGGSDYGSGGGRHLGLSDDRGGMTTTNGSGGGGSSGTRSDSDQHMGSGSLPTGPLPSGEAPDNGVPFHDVALGGLLGKGSFGSVFYGWWNDMTVAIKVIEHKSTPAENVAAKEEVETTLGLKLDHPNIVRTFKYANRELAPTVKAARAWRASMDRARSSVDCGARASFDAGPDGLDALGRPSTDASAAPGRPGNDPGRGARVRAQWDTSTGSDDFCNAVAAPSTGGGSCILASSPCGSQRLSGTSTRGIGRIPGLDDVPDMVSFSQARPTGPRRLETWIVLELCGLGSLQSAIDEGAFRSERSVFEGKPDMHVILPTALEVASALAYLHSNNVLHGDLTTNNVLLVETEDGAERPFSVKVSDFGLSRVHASESAISTNTFGTVTHMPPELLSEGQMSKAADVYAMGVLLWELYLSERPWAGLRPVQIILKKSQGKARLTWPDGAPAQYKALAERCMGTDCKSRPTFAEVAAELAEMTKADREGQYMAGRASACYEQDWADSVPQPIRRRPSLPAANNAACASLPLSAN